MECVFDNNGILNLLLCMSNIYAFIKRVIAATQLTLDDLGVLKQLIQPVAAYWIALADQLRMASHVPTIRSTLDNTRPPDFLRDLLCRWLTKGHPTLEELCQALREDDEIIGGANVAYNLEERFQGQRGVETEMLNSDKI